jgi:hypothetical protein
MKTNVSARRILRIRVFLLCLALTLAVAAELLLGESMVAGIGLATAIQTDEVQAPNFSLGDVFDAIR